MLLHEDLSRSQKIEFQRETAERLYKYLTAHDINARLKSTHVYIFKNQTDIDSRYMFDLQVKSDVTDGEYVIYINDNSDAWMKIVKDEDTDEILRRQMMNSFEYASFASRGYSDSKVFVKVLDWLNENIAEYDVNKKSIRIDKERAEIFSTLSNELSAIQGVTVTVESNKVLVTAKDSARVAFTVSPVRNSHVAKNVWQFAISRVIPGQDLISAKYLTTVKSDREVVDFIYKELVRLNLTSGIDTVAEPVKPVKPVVAPAAVEKPVAKPADKPVSKVKRSNAVKLDLSGIFG